MKSSLFRRGRGQALVEYIIILPTLLILVLGAIQFALLYRVKSTLNYATFIGARQGALKNASSLSIKDGIAASMTPLFTYKDDIPSLLKGRAISMIEVFNPLTMKVEVLSPTKKMADDFGIADPTNPDSKRLIPNDNLTYRPTTEGGSSGINVQDANLLKIRVTYCAKLVVPLANVTIYSLVNGIKGVTNLANEWFAESNTIPTTTNMCSAIDDRVEDKASTVLEYAQKLDIDTSALTNGLTTLTDKLSGFTIPGLDWSLGRYRIPITAEAVVRMQSPARFDK
ncbi:MAG TPA: TadE/TadG family type IV pilus assembly protein [Rhodocyclaceae bacterium]|jgi:hypothetical protein|nr:TadE/TadG family type IV pilus assembly protein [Rhodocyclaceae bacterium]